MSYKVVWHEKALDDLKGIDKSQVRAVFEKTKNYLSKDPLSLGKPLKGIFKGLYSYRLGDNRVIYAIDRKEKLIMVLKVGDRKDIYKA